MRSLRSVALIVWLAIAVAASQQLVVLHDLGHAHDSAAGDGQGVPQSSKCEQHSACVQLSGALGSRVRTVAFVAASPPRGIVVHERVAFPEPRRAFLSRAPPDSLA